MIRTVFKDFWKQKLHENHWHKLLLIHTSHMVFISIYTWYYVSWFIKEKVCIPKTLQILCILCSTSMTHTATIPQGIPAPFCALCFEDQCRKHEKKPLCTFNMSLLQKKTSCLYLHTITFMSLMCRIIVYTRLFQAKFVS